MRNLFRWLLNQPPYIPDEDPDIILGRQELEDRKQRTQDLIERTDRLINNEARITVYRNMIENRRGRPRHAT